MREEAFVASNPESKDSRRLALVVVSFFVFIVLSIGLLFYHSISIDRSYSREIGVRLATMQHLQSLTKEVANVHRNMRNIIFSSDSAEAEVYKQSVVEGQKRLDTLVTSLNIQLSGTDEHLKLDRISAAYQKYLIAYNKMLQMNKSASRDQIYEYSKKELRPVYSQWQEGVEELSLFIMDNAIKDSEMSSDKNARDSKIFLFIGIVPFGIIALALLYQIITLLYRYDFHRKKNEH